MANPLRLRRVWHDCVIGPCRSDSDIAYMQDRGNYAEEIELFGGSEANCVKCVLDGWASVTQQHRCTWLGTLSRFHSSLSSIPSTSLRLLFKYS